MLGLVKSSTQPTSFFPPEDPSMFRKPSVADLRQAAQEIGMNPSDDYLRAVEQIVIPLANAYAMLDAIADELPAVKYPRGPVHRPQPHENPHGAWYVTTSITGKPGGKLAGRRIALKDNVCLAGVPMMIGAGILEGYVPDVDTAIGGDQAGSIRIPASHCGIVGLKPTYGLVPYTGIAPLEITLDTCGPMTAGVSDNALLLEVIAGPDGIDSRQRGAASGRYTDAL